MLQAIYKFAPSDFLAFVGQQVDVFIAAPSRAATTRGATAATATYGSLFRLLATLPPFVTASTGSTASTE